MRMKIKTITINNKSKKNPNQQNLCQKTQKNNNREKEIQYNTKMTKMNKIYSK